VAGAIVTPATATLSKPRAQYESALAALRQTENFRFAERITMSSPIKRVIRSEVRFTGPNRIRTQVTALVPPPTAALVSVQVGRVTCQAPPGTCYRGLRADPARAVRSLIQPHGRISYGFGRAPRGMSAVTLTTTQNDLTYFARLTIGTNGLPKRFATTVTKAGAVVALQQGVFTYGHRYTITLPRKAGSSHRRLRDRSPTTPYGQGRG
jgi:hypothetical protein